MNEPLVMTRRIAAPASVVFDFLVDPAKLVRWLGVAADVDARVDGALAIDVTGDGLAQGRFVQIDPPHRVVFTWGWRDHPTVTPGSTTVAVDLRPDGDATVLTLTHSGLPGEEQENHARGWTYFLARLSPALAGETNPPVRLEEIAATDPRLVEETT